MALHFVSDKEFTRLEILADLASARLTTPAAAKLLGLERRQVQRSAKAFQEQGAPALIQEAWLAMAAVLVRANTI